MPRKPYSELTPEQKRGQIAASLRWRKRNRAKFDAYQREYHQEYRAKNSARIKAAQRKWRKDNAERVKVQDREKGLRRLYGLTLADYGRMLAAQGGRCALCGSEPRPGENLHVDHDHETGAVRALLCRKCNTALGWFEARQTDVLDYLTTHARAVK